MYTRALVQARALAQVGTSACPWTMHRFAPTLVAASLQISSSRSTNTVSRARLRCTPPPPRAKFLPVSSPFKLTTRPHPRPCSLSTPVAFKDKRWETGALPAAKRLLATLKYGSRPEDMRNVALKLVIKRVALENYIKAHHEELAAAVRAQKADLANKAATDSTAVARFLEQLAAARKEVTAHRSAAERAQAELLAIKESAAELASAAAESAASKNEVGALRAQLAASASTIAALKGDCAAATHALGAAQAASAADRAALLADARAELDKLRAELADAHARETAAALAAVQSSAHASVGALAAQVTSLTAALDASRADLVNSQAAAAEAIRDAQSSFNAAMSRSEEIIREKNAEIANLDKGLEDLVKSADESAARVRELEASLVTAAAERDTWAARWAVVDSKRSRCLEELLSLKGSIRVMSRVRPPLNSEMAPQSSGAGAGAGAGGKSGSRYTVPKGGTSVGAADADPLFAFPGATADDATDIDVVEAPAAGVDGTMRDGKRTRFTLQRAFPPTASQSDVFGEVEGLVQSALDGHRVTIFAYGQTGSGKTHTMMGDATADGAGIIPRATDLIFDRVARMADQGWKTVVTGAFCASAGCNVSCVAFNPDPPPPLPLSPLHSHCSRRPRDLQ